MTEHQGKPWQRKLGGLTVTSTNPFDGIETPQNAEALAPAFKEKFVEPFYMNLRALSKKKSKLTAATSSIAQEITPEVIAQLLGEEDWRTRTVGAYFCAIANMAQFEEQLGKLLLKSEVTFAGAGYCRALAVLNTDAGIHYLHEYLNHYLAQKDAHFDQRWAMAALIFLDDRNGTDEVEQHIEAWEAFVEHGSHWDIEETVKAFQKDMMALYKIKRFLARK